MKTKAIVTVLPIILIFAACVPPATASPRASTFAFNFKYTPCGSIPMYDFSTTSERLVYTPLGDTASTTISLHLSDDELESIYQKAVSIGFFDYPSKFIVPDDQVLGYRTPAASFELGMVNIAGSERSNSVSWTDDAVTKPEYPKADQLRELMELINEIIQSHPEVQRLPRSNALCA